MQQWSEPQVMGAEKPTTPTPDTTKVLPEPPDGHEWSEPQVMGDTTASPTAAPRATVGSMIVSTIHGAGETFGINPKAPLTDNPITNLPGFIAHAGNVLLHGGVFGAPTPKPDEATELAKGVVGSVVIPPLKGGAEIGEGARQGDWNKFFHGVGMSAASLFPFFVAEKGGPLRGTIEDVARTAEERAKVKALAPKHPEDLANLSVIKDRIPTFKAATQAGTDATIFRNLQQAEAGLDAAKKAIPPNAVVFKEPLLEKIDQLIDSMSKRQLAGNEAAIAAAQELRAHIALKGWSIPFNEIYAELKGLDKRVGESGGFRLTTESDAAVNWARRGVGGALSNSLKESATNAGVPQFADAMGKYSTAKTLATVVEHRRPEVWGQKTTQAKLEAAQLPPFGKTKSTVAPRRGPAGIANLRANVAGAIAGEPKPVPKTPTAPGHPLARPYTPPAEIGRAHPLVNVHPLTGEPINVPPQVAPPGLTPVSGYPELPQPQWQTPLTHPLAQPSPVIGPAGLEPLGGYRELPQPTPFNPLAQRHPLLPESTPLAPPPVARPLPPPAPSIGGPHPAVAPEAALPGSPQPFGTLTFSHNEHMGGRIVKVYVDSTGRTFRF